jgi:hypothetical protein
MRFREKIDINTHLSLSPVTFTETIFCPDKYLGRSAGDASRKAFSLHVDCLSLLNGFETQKDIKFFVKIFQHHIS